ncbi:nucleotidyltransferase family protein [Amycolatopsis decaplanina]|uniref:MobA-like NTP transferase domain-containing protein n=1 Tax=Amycolatopsis decaplanina DSM 44594 TaxID=1284240 RepID=M2YU32_9PSEU|nr:nucleotidyltransferase family protein [Amycolatopsis decaplanina]EME58397.1 hypothetical protein H074_17488 [Amycolatopsis decaplanina DSM 44594]
MAEVAGLLLAAGAGRRFGGPKALAVVHGEPFVVRALRVLTDAGCTPVRVVLGASAPQVRALLPDSAAAVVAEDWESGMGASLRAGLSALTETDAEAAVVHLVDLPGVGAGVVRRVAAGADENIVARAAYEGIPGHPVVLGRRWWLDIMAGASGDKGARDWLKGRQDLRLVECGDLGTGHDVDRREDLPR